MLNLDAKVTFEQSPQTVVKLLGVVTAKKVDVLASADKSMLSFNQLKVTMSDVRPLAQLVKLASVELAGPVVNISHDRAGRLNLLSADEAGATKSGAARVCIDWATGLKDSQNLRIC